MPQRREWRQPKQDHSVYVQQLFKDFLARNNENPVKKPNNETRTNFCRAESKISEHRKQPGIFDRAVYARFERNTNSVGFTRQEATHRSKTDLMRWIDQQRNKTQTRVAVQKTARTDDYLNLPNNFFSGTEQLKMPFEMTDKTVGNVTNNFIPPATSTPFDRLTCFGVSGVLSDPDEFQTKQSNQKPTACTKLTIWDTFIKKCEEYFTTTIKDYDCQSVLKQQRDEIDTLLKSVSYSVPVHQLVQSNEKPIETFSTMPGKQKDEIPLLESENHSFVGKQKFHPLRTCSPPVSLATPKTTANDFSAFPDLMLYTAPVPVNNKKQNNVTFFIDTCSPTNPQVDSNQDDLLLTASPPSPNLCTSRRRFLYNESTFLLDQMPTDDTLMEKLDALLEDEELNILGDDIDHGFEFGTPPAETIMNVSFPLYSQTINNPADNTNFEATRLNFSQALMAPTIQEFREAMF